MHGQMPAMTPLEALLEKYREHIEFLGVPLTSCDSPNASGDRMLHIAARNGALEDIELLCRLGAAIDAGGDLGYTPLHFAAMTGHREAVEMLLKYRANKNILNEFGETPADAAALSGHADIQALFARD